MRLGWWLHKSVKMIELHTLNEWTSWHANCTSIKLFLRKRVNGKEGWLTGLTLFIRLHIPLITIFIKSSVHPIISPQLFVCLFFVWFYFYGLQHWFTHFQSYSLPYFLIIHYFLCREIYSMCSSDFHHLFNSFFLHAACLFVSLWEQGERDVNLCDVFMSLCI